MYLSRTPYKVAIRNRCQYRDEDFLFNQRATRSTPSLKRASQLAFRKVPDWYLGDARNLSFQPLGFETIQTSTKSHPITTDPGMPPPVDNPAIDFTEADSWAILLLVQHVV